MPDHPVRTEGTSARHYRFPPERWFVSFIAERQRNPTPAVSRLQGNYGPEGMTLMSATLLWALTAAVLGCTGIVFLLASGDHGWALGVGYVLMLVGFFLTIPAFIRGFQGVMSGRRFRGSRPFVRR